MKTSSETCQDWGFRLIAQQGKELGNKDVDRSWQVEKSYEDQDDQEAGIEASIAICEAAYGSFVNQIGSSAPNLTRATCVEIQASNVEAVMSPSCSNVEKSGDHVCSAISTIAHSWSDVVKQTTTHSATSSLSKVSLTSRPTCSSAEVKKIMQEAAARAAEVILKDIRR